MAVYKQTFTSIWIHLVWSTKNREPLIYKHIKYKLYDQIRKISYDKGYHLDFINGIEDHVHLLISLDPKFAISDMVKNIKGLSWEWMRKKKLIEEYFSWQDGYSGFSVSPQHINKIRNYIKNQEQHHKNMDFEEELKILKQTSSQI